MAFWVGLQRSDLIGQRFILRVYLADLLANLFNFLLRAAHGDESVRAENVVHQQRKQRKAQNLPRVFARRYAISFAREKFRIWFTVHHAFASCADIHDPGLRFACDLR